MKQVVFLVVFFALVAMVPAIAAIEVDENTSTPSLLNQESRDNFGNYAINEMNSESISQPITVESDHPYANNFEYTWKISQPGADQMRLHFDKLELASYDRLTIYNDQSKELVSYGTYDDKEDFWTEWQTTDTLRVKLVTDNQYTAYGFLIDQIEYRKEKVPPTEHLAESYHPYANNFEYIWKISQSGANQIRIHFKKLELASADSLTIYDDQGHQLEYYGSYYDDEDFWTEWQTTDTVRVKLTTSNSYTAYGLLIDQIEYRNEEVPSTEYFAESYHPYANNYEYTWKISQSGANQIRLHFDKLELASGDGLTIYNDQGRQLEYYGSYYDNEDFWTEWQTTDTVRVKLTTSNSYTAYGFLIDYIETDKGIIYPTPTLPKLHTDPAADITETSATLHGHLTNGKAGETYDVCFRYHEEDGDKTKVGFITISATNPNYEYRLTGLKPGTTYYYRAVHKDSQGSSNPEPIDAAEYQTFTTTHSESPNLKIDDVIPNGIINVGRSTLTVTGNGFNPDITVQLQHAEYEQHIIRSDEKFESTSRIRATVDLNGAPEGYWNLLVENPDGQKQIKNTAIFVSRPAEKQQKEDPSITLVGSQNLWIDSLSKDNRLIYIHYLITPADYSGQMVMEISDKNGEKIGKIIKTVTSGGQGYLTWDGKINSAAVNPAKNPYTIRLRIGSNTDPGLTDAISESREVFVGRPVLFVHGIFSLAEDIENSEGFQTFSADHYAVTVEYADSKAQTFFGNIPLFSGRLEQRIAGLKEETGAEKVDIVAHSMGGLVSRYYIEKQGGRDDVGKLIMVQTPNHGSEWADLRALLGYASDFKKAYTLATTFGLTTVIDVVADELIPSTYNYAVEFGLDQYDTTAAGQMAPYHQFIVDLNGNERPYSSDFYMSQGLVTDKIQDPSGYVVIASQNLLTPSHYFVTISNPLTGNTLYSKRLPGVTNKGDTVVSYNSAKLTVAPIVGIDGDHLNPWGKQQIMNYLAEFLSNPDADLQSVAEMRSLNWLTTSDQSKETNMSSETGFWSDWISTNVSQSEDLNLALTIEPFTTSARLLFLWDEGTLSLSFTAPNGTVTDTVVSEDQCEYSIGAAPGTWNVTIHPVSIPGNSVELTAASYQINPIIFEVLPDAQGTKPGDALPVDVYYGLDSEPSTGAIVTATVKSPDGSLNLLSLHDDGTSGDDTAGDGVYSNTFTDTAEPGTYLIIANGSWTIGDVTLSRITRNFITLMEYPDLTIDDITITPQDPLAGEDINIAATISNIGSADATNVSVTVYTYINSLRHIIDNRALDIPTGGSASITAQWKARANLHTIIVLINSCDEVIEESYSNNIANATVDVKSSRMELESANITISEGGFGSVPIILTNCTDLQYITGTFAFNSSIVEFVNVSSTAPSINYENTTGLVRFNITYGEEVAGDINVADIVMCGLDATGEGTETKVIIGAFDGLGSHSATMVGSNQITLIENIIDHQELHADFTVDVRSGAVPHTVQFNDTSSGNPTSWLWSFGDGNTSDEQHPIHTYTVPGNHTVSLTVSNGNGNNTVTKEHYIRVHPALPNAELIFNVNYNRSTFNDTIASGASPCRLTYYTGAYNLPENRESILGNLSFVLDAPEIIGTDPAYAEINGTRVTWTFPPSAAIGPGTALSTSATTSVFATRTSGVTLERSCNRMVFTEAGVQQVTLKMIFDTVDLDNLWGRIDCTETDDLRSAIVPGMISTDLPLLNLREESARVQFTINRSAIEAGRQYTFSCAVEVDPLRPVTYAPACAIWEVRNSTSATAPVGTAVTLPVELLPQNVTSVAFSSATPCEWSCTKNEHVISSLHQRAAPVSAPVANFTANTTAGPAPLAVRFTDTSTGGPTSWSWSFGDGATSTEQHPTHTYTVGGTYTVTLTASNPYGSDEKSMIDYIIVEHGTISIRVLGDGNATIGDEIHLSGMNTDSVLTYLFLTGAGLDATGVNLMNLSMPVINDNPSTFTIMDVEIDDSWEYRWNTQGILGGSLEEGVYTIYAVSAPRDATHLPDAVYATATIQLQPPFIIAEASSATITPGDEFQITGIAGGAPPHVQLWIFGPNYYGRYGGALEARFWNVEADGTFECILDDTDMLQEGQYYVVVQHPVDHNYGVMADTATGVIYGEGITNVTLTDLQPADAVTALINALDSPGVNDIYVTLNFTVVGSAPAANFTANVTSGTIPLTARFTDTSTGDPTSWSWSFGDGNTSTKQHPVHTYTVPGNHTVTLTVDGGLSTATKPSYIKVTPVLFGDANEDGKVNQADTLTVLQEVVGLREQPDTDTEQFRKTDVRANNVIEVGDALFIAQYNVGLRDIWFEVI